MIQYLKVNSYYIDLYDLQTIKECLHWFSSIKRGFESKRSQAEFQKFTPEEFDKEVHKVASYTVNVIKGERYRHKDKTINDWINRDKAIQEKYDSAVAPDILCDYCKETTTVVSKDLHDYLDQNSEILFMYKCDHCNKRQAYYQDGTKWIYKEPKCPECGEELLCETKKVNDILISTDSCSHCKYTKEDIFDFNKSRIEREAREAHDQKLLKEYRDVFCLDEKTGPEYINSIDKITSLVDEINKSKAKEKDPIYQKAKKLKKLKVTQVKELMSNALKDKGYLELQFDKPELGQFIIVEFSVNDSVDNRRDNESEKIACKLITETLSNTNWRLMSDGIRYRLGIISGRIKAYEREEDLMKLVK